MQQHEPLALAQHGEKAHLALGQVFLHQALALQQLGVGLDVPQLRQVGLLVRHLVPRHLQLQPAQVAGGTGCLVFIYMHILRAKEDLIPIFLYCKLYVLSKIRGQS